MIVNRREFKVKPGKGKEAIELAKAEAKRVAPNLTVRFYSCTLGPFNTIAWEAEYESLAAYEKANADINARISPEFWKKWYGLVDIGGESLIWTVV
jgi:hypothetical protein